MLHKIGLYFALDYISYMEWAIRHNAHEIETVYIQISH